MPTDVLIDPFRYCLGAFCAWFLGLIMGGVAVWWYLRGGPEW